MVTNGKGSNWLWSIWIQSRFHSFFNRSIQYSWYYYFPLKHTFSPLVCIYIYIVLVENWLKTGGSATWLQVDNKSCSKEICPGATPLSRVKLRMAPG